MEKDKVTVTLDKKDILYIKELLERETREEQKFIAKEPKDLLEIVLKVTLPMVINYEKKLIEIFDKALSDEVKE